MHAGVAVQTDGTPVGSALEAHLTACVQEYLHQFLYDTATFLCERLAAEFPTEENTLLLARCHILTNQPQRAYALLKGKGSPPLRYVFAQACMTLNRLVDAEEALLPDMHSAEVVNGAAGLFLLGRIHAMTNRHVSAASHFHAALRRDPMLWSAFEALCGQGAFPEASAYLEDALAAEAASASAPSSAYTTPAGPTGLAGERGTSADQNLTAETPAEAAQGHQLPEPLQRRRQPFAFPTPDSGQQGPGWSAAAALPMPGSSSGGAHVTPESSQGPDFVTPVGPSMLGVPPPPRKARQAWSREDRGPVAPAPHPPRHQPWREPKLRRLFHGQGGVGEDPGAPAGSQQQHERQYHHPRLQQQQCSPLAEMGAPGSCPSRVGARTPEGAAAALRLLHSLGRPTLLLAQYRCEAALAAFEELPPRQRQTGWVLCQTGRALAESVRYAAAADAFAQARRLDPTRLKGMEVYSTALWQLKRAPELAALAAEALASDRLAPEAWCCAGNALSLQRDHEAALRAFQRALQLDPGLAYAHTLAGHEHVALEAWDGGLAAYRTALTVDPRHYNAWFGMGHVFYRQEKWGMAEYHFRRALAIRPRSSVLLCYAGMALHKLDRLPEALRMLEEASTVDPGNPLARFETAAVLLALDRPRQALAVLQALQESAPQEASTLFQMGKIHKRLGDTDEALRCFCAALDLQPPAADTDAIKAAIERLRVTDDDVAEEM